MIYFMELIVFIDWTTAFVKGREKAKRKFIPMNTNTRHLIVEMVQCSFPGRIVCQAAVVCTLPTVRRTAGSTAAARARAPAARDLQRRCCVRASPL